MAFFSIEINVEPLNCLNLNTKFNLMKMAFIYVVAGGGEGVQEVEGGGGQLWQALVELLSPDQLPQHLPRLDPHELGNAEQIAQCQGGEGDL